jgi:hypothetical protein
MQEPVSLENGIIAPRFIGSDAAMGLRNGPSKTVPAQTHRSTVVSRGARVGKQPLRSPGKVKAAATLWVKRGGDG